MIGISLKSFHTLIVKTTIAYNYEKLTTSPVAEKYIAHVVKGRHYSVYTVYLLSIWLKHRYELQRCTCYSLMLRSQRWTRSIAQCRVYGSICAMYVHAASPWPRQAPRSHFHMQRQASTDAWCIATAHGRKFEGMRICVLYSTNQERITSPSEHVEFKQHYPLLKELNRQLLKYSLDLQTSKSIS